MSTSDRGYFTPLSHDVRVRERLLGAGIISQAEIEQYLANLPDNEANSESLGIGQPALTTPQPPAPPAPAPIRVSPAMSSHASAPSTDIDDDDDEEEEEDDDDDMSGDDEVAAAPAEEQAAPAHTIAVGEPHPSAPVETKEAFEAPQDAQAAAEAAQPEQAPAAPEAPAEAAPEASSATTEEQVG